jgi:hypothetical protein
VEITGDDERPRTLIDYGEGECDRWATVTVGEGEDAETRTINLKKRGKNRNNQQDTDEG